MQPCDVRLYFKVEDLTHQLEELRSGRMGGNNNQRSYPPQLVELERLRRELAYRKQLNEQQNNMISQQRAQLSMGKEEMAKIDGKKKKILSNRVEGTGEVSEKGSNFNASLFSPVQPPIPVLFPSGPVPGRSCWG